MTNSGLVGGGVTVDAPRGSTSAPAATRVRGGVQQLLEELELDTELADLRDRLSELRPLLVDEFAHEEGEDGLHEEIRCADPAGGCRVVVLDEQHCELLDDLSVLQQRCDECLERLAAINKLRGALAWKVRDHQRLEHQLLLEAHFRDVGGH